MFSFRTGFWLFVFTFLVLPSSTCLPIGSSVAQFFFCLFLGPALVQLVPIGVGPFLPHGLPISTWDSRCHGVLHVGSLPSFGIRPSSLHTTFSILRSIFRWQVWTIICSFPWSDRVWAPYNRTGNSPGFHDGFFVSRFWNLLGLNLFQAIPFLLLIYFPELLRNGISCPTLWDILKSFSVQFDPYFSTVCHYFGLLCADL